ncbi:hypothetical protein QTN25_002916 [Entamoeba marina]
MSFSNNSAYCLSMLYYIELHQYISTIVHTIESGVFDLRDIQLPSLQNSPILHESIRNCNKIYSHTLLADHIKINVDVIIITKQYYNHTNTILKELSLPQLPKLPIIQLLHNTNYIQFERNLKVIQVKVKGLENDQEQHFFTIKQNTKYKKFVKKVWNTLHLSSNNKMDVVGFQRGVKLNDDDLINDDIVIECHIQHSSFTSISPSQGLTYSLF